MRYRVSIAILVIGFLACLAWIVYSNTRGTGPAPLNEIGRGTGPTPLEETPRGTDVTPQDEIRRQERLWQASAIRDYRIVTYLRQPIGYPQNLTYATTVRNEQIANETCLSGQCNVMSLQHPSTVPDLFSLIRSLSKDSVDGFHASPDQ